jgi:hypothetical protein
MSSAQSACRIFLHPLKRMLNASKCSPLGADLISAYYAPRVYKVPRLQSAHHTSSRRSKLTKVDFHELLFSKSSDHRTMTLWLSSFSKITNVYVACHLHKFLAISRGCGIHFLALCVGAELISAYCVTRPVYKA